MKKTAVIIALIAAACLPAASQGTATIFPEVEIGPIRMLNGVGGAPQSNVTVELFNGARIPLVRLHDISSAKEYACDLFQIFPDFDADENKAENYDFAISDDYVKPLIDAGVKIIWRLGNSHHEPTALKKYGAWPPKDFAKWARICEHVIRHYNEGWADGHHWNIDMWEIWNEPDGDQSTLSASENIPASEKHKVGKVKRYEVAPHSWGGTMEQYYEFYSTVFKHLKGKFPELKIGGPANAGKWAEEPFVKEMCNRGVKVDFYTWHRYSRTPEHTVKLGKELRGILDRYGWNDVPTILDEWNYVTTWDGAGQSYSAKARGSIKGTAYTAATMTLMQNEGATDMMTYYDWRYNTTYNGAFDKTTGAETPTYHVFCNWAKLLEYGTQVKVECSEKDVYAVAARNAEGEVCLMVTRFNDDDSVSNVKSVYVPLPEGCTEPICWLSDSDHNCCEYPFAIIGGRVKLNLEPNSSVFVEF